MAHPFARDLVLLAVLGASCAVGVRTGTSLRANPVRRVVRMLQSMQEKITAEGKKEEAMFEKFQCYCKTGTEELSSSISAAETKIPQVTSTLDESKATKVQLGSELAQHEKDRSAAKEAIAKATALREKEAATFAKASSDAKTNIAATKKAIAALEAGTAASFLQDSASASLLQKLSIDIEMSTTDRESLSSFLSDGEGDADAAPTPEIIGILQQMLETMESNLADLEAVEAKAISDYEGLIAAKKREILANSEAIESKLAREGQVGEQIVALEEDLDDTKKGLAEDTKFLADLERDCAKKTSEWETVQKTRQQEMLCLADTIKILNDDDALDLFKKTLPSPSLLQTVVSGKEVKQMALEALRQGQDGHMDRRLALISMALRGGGDFSKVLAMVDSMVSLLGKEQKDDDKKKAYCETQMDKAEDEGKVLAQKNSDLLKAIEEAQGHVATLEEEIKALTEGIKALDKQVVEATETRKAEHNAYVETMADDNAAKDLLGAAKNRLAKFYSPKLYKAAPKKELSAAGRIEENFGVSFTQVSMRASTTMKAKYAPKEEESVGVTEMLDMLIGDLDKEVQELTVEENDAQVEYEQFMEDSASKRSIDAKTLSEKEGAKANLETEMQEMGEDQKSTLSELMVKEEELKDLHLQCDWLLKNYGTRKEARAGEVDSLKKAKAVLSGADFAFIQMASVHRHLRGAAARKLYR